MRVEVDAVPVGTIRDLENRNDLILTTDTQDIKFIKEYFGNPDWWDFDGCFVKIEDGDYEEVYCFVGIVPVLNKTVYKLERKVIE